MRKADAELTDESYRWLSQRLHEAFESHGKISGSDLDKVNHPRLPPDWPPDVGI